MRRALKQLVLAAAGMILLSALPARADVIISVNEVGSNIVTTGSGSLDIKGLTHFAAVPESPSIDPNDYLEVGATGPGTSADLYFRISGPSSLGTGTVDIHPTSGSGDRFGMQNNLLQVPAGYVSGQSLSGTDTYLNQSFSSIGLTPGTYVWSWGSGADADSLTIQIGTAVPLPSSLAGGSVLLAMAGVLAWRRRLQV